VHALHDTARARRQRLAERTLETGTFRTEAVDDDRAPRDVGADRRSHTLEFRSARDPRQRAAQVRTALDADTASERAVLLRSTTQELGPTREAVIDAAVQRLDVSQKQAGEAYAVAEAYEANPRSVWGYVQGLTRLSQRTPWQDGRFVLDRAASRLLTTVH
jgi:hypothetical protein